MNVLSHPLESLKAGTWFKLICGASFQDLPAIRSLALAYSLAGADCIDIAADRAVMTAATEGISVAKLISLKRSLRPRQPWLMVSLNDAEDPHFRKAVFDPTHCPVDCSRPCEAVCPTQAIVLTGVSEPRCYGCGRCLPVCPQHLIETRSYLTSPSEIAPWIERGEIDAVEIHTQVGHEAAFQRLWQAIAPGINHLKLLAISCQGAPEVIDYLYWISELITPLPCALIWQTDGRPMSGDIGKGTTKAAIKLARKVLEAQLPGFVQLAGGTNAHTVPKLKTLGLLRERGEESYLPRSRQTIAGIAYGSYARSQLNSTLATLERRKMTHLENSPDLLAQSVETAQKLVCQLKSLFPFEDENRH